MTNTKATQRDYFNAVIALAKGEPCPFTEEEMVEFAEGRIALLDKKSANRKPSKTAEENKALAEVVLEVLTAEGATVSEIMKRDERLAGLSTPKVTAILKMMKEDGLVDRTVDKKKALFSRVG